MYKEQDPLILASLIWILCLDYSPKNQIPFGGKHQSENYRKLTKKTPAKYGRSTLLLSTVTWPMGLYNNN